ncbi:MAG: histidinol dehydrogenase, partial [Oscillospiraceae bacterium]|nr:histidinol dehydrogenase [Oscillospiraceae bacterium]
MIKTMKSEEFMAFRQVREASLQADVAAVVAEIIADVKLRGDAALRDYTARFDGCLIDTFEVSQAEKGSAFEEVGADYLAVIKRAAANIEEFHRRQIRQGFVMTPGNGIVLGQRILPIDCAGIYVPGGTAAYPSTLLMNVIPARLAGVSKIIIVSPPSKDGRIDAGIIAAAMVAGADRIFKVGGAQAIAALAHGTESIPRADKITGPGNAYVAEAKRQVFGIVGIDMIAGPSDILVIADKKANPSLVAADMLSQCEHGIDSAAVLITDSADLAGMVAGEIETQLSLLPRQEIARESVDNNGMIIIADTLEQAFEISDIMAPEHLEIFLDEPFSYLHMVKNAGSVFL